MAVLRHFLDRHSLLARLRELGILRGGVLTMVLKLALIGKVMRNISYD